MSLDSRGVDGVLDDKLSGELGMDVVKDESQSAVSLSGPSPDSLPPPMDSSREDAGLLLQPTASASPTIDITPASFSGSQNTTPLDRPLNVTDALSYLDAVKHKFHDQPNVYNHFLDIMKEFKSQIIDTPGVIKRVSHLFNGHAVLIQGFNTFLPAGYRIECTKDDHDSSYITVTTPTGTTMQTTNNGLGNGPILWSTTEARTPVSVAPAPSTTRQSSVEPKSRDKQTIEPAVQYVQKIKQRCDAETYRQFLDILSKYHHKPDMIDEEEVSKQIAHLFKDDPDLRADFRIFMPERNRQLMEDAPSSSRSEKGKQRKAEQVNSLPQKRKRKAIEREMIEIMPKVASKAKKAKHTPVSDLTASSYKGRASPPPSVRRHAGSRVPAPTVLAAAPEDSQAHVFFDRVKRYLDDNRETYNEFLKLVNLFTQEFIDTARLVRESRNFLGDGELLAMLREIVGWDERRDREYSLEQQQSAGHSWTRPTVIGREVKAKATKAELDAQFGSYRKIPAAEANVTCSGRDEMCRLVLNDEWVSHPTWSSEDAGFITPRMNIYEEALHRSEEERHEYDFHIEAIVRTITMLEPLNNKMASLSPEDRASYKPKPNLNGQIKSIHHRVIKKIYGREAGLSVIHAMQDTPALAIPIVLQRLKQKEEEWKRAQREWNKVWREVDARNYSKSLDHQGILFKAADKKAITTKAFVNQIETAREEQITKRASLIDPLFARTRPRHQLEFVMDDTQVLQDTLMLTFSFLDRTQGQINFAERKRIETFLRSFVPLFFMLDPVVFNAAFNVVQETVESDLSDDASIMDDVEVSSVGSGGSRAKSRKATVATVGAGGDLRKKLLKSEQAKSSNRKTRNYSSPQSSRMPSPLPVDEELKQDIPIASPTQRIPPRNTFFTNTIFYTLLRILEVLYSRLALFKNIAARLTSPEKPTIPTDPGSFPHPESLPMGVRVSNAEHFYDLLLESCERLFDNELDQNAFEDQVRFMFGIKEAYKISTVDKIIGCLIKQVQLLIGDGKSQDLQDVLRRERELACPTTQDLINSRKSAEKILGPDENLFRVDWLPESKHLTFQLLGKDDSSFDDSEVLTGRWQSYVDSFVSSDTTEGITLSRTKRPFLRKNLPLELKPPHVATRDSLEIKICVRTYRLFYVSSSEDYLFQLHSREEMQRCREKLHTRQALRQQWLQEQLNV